MTAIGFPRERLLQVAGARLHLREIGHGPAIVVLHGGPDFDHEYLLVIEERLYAETWSREDYDLEPALRTLAAPAIVVRGRRDFIPLEHAQGIATAIPGARLLELDDCGHFVAMDEPQTFARIVREFLA